MDLSDFSLWFLLGGMMWVSAIPIPHFAALGLVLVAGSGCVLLASVGATLLCMVLFLIYLGGMLVVFAYASALAADAHPETLGDRVVLWKLLFYIMGAAVFVGVYKNTPSLIVGGESGWNSVTRIDSSGVSDCYLSGGPMLLGCAWVLLLTLIVVFELIQGVGRGGRRP